MIPGYEYEIFINMGIFNVNNRIIQLDLDLNNKTHLNLKSRNSRE